TEIESLIIRWPSGTVDMIEFPDINETHHITEGQYPLSSPEFSLSDVIISPVPVTDRLFISHNENLAGTNVIIYDVSGRLIASEKMMSNSLDVSKLNTGVYFLNLKINGQAKSIKFIKK